MVMTPILNLTPAQQALLMQLMQQFIPGIRVWAFGSRVKGNTRPSSDLDLVVFSKPSQRSQVFALQEALEESNLPFNVDLLIWDEIPDNFKTTIQNGFIELGVNAAGKL